MRTGHLHADPRECSFETEARFDTDEHEVKSVREGIDQLPLPSVGFGANEHVGKIKSHYRGNDEREIQLQHARRRTSDPEQPKDEDRESYDHDQTNKRVNSWRKGLGIPGSDQLLAKSHILRVDEADAAFFDRVD